MSFIMFYVSLYGVSGSQSVKICEISLPFYSKFVILLYDSILENDNLFQVKGQGFCKAKSEEILRSTKKLHVSRFTHHVLRFTFPLTH